MIDFLLDLDRDVFLALNGAHHPWLDPVMVAFSHKYTWIPLYAFLGYIIFKTFGKNSVWVFITIALSITLADQITTTAMKPYFERLRPSHEPSLRDTVHIVDDYRGSKFGFASSHAANTFGLAAFLFFLFRGRRTGFGWMFLWAAVVTYSRIYLGVHYPGDIIVGACVGIGAAFLCLAICKWMLVRFDLAASRS